MVDWVSLRMQVLTRDNFICQTCLKPFNESEVEVHHIIPRRLRGIDSPNNLISACTRCHKLIELYWNILRRKQTRRKYNNERKYEYVLEDETGTCYYSRRKQHG